MREIAIRTNKEKMNRLENGNIKNVFNFYELIRKLVEISEYFINSCKCLFK